jgi:Holliday junction DNA helicase RuvA
MFSYLAGTTLSIEDGRISVLVDGTGLGLEVFVSPLTLSRCRTGEKISLFLHHHITEVSQTLFGFENREEKEVFKSLLKISGVGGKTAINILGLGISPLLTAINDGNEKLLSSVPGVGKKMALKIILELKNKVNIEDLNISDEAPRLAPAHSREITDALIGMGYDKRRVEEIVKMIPEELSTLQEKTVYCIRKLSL